jgi:predicted enzyme related to lactoylglutathione lyase
MTLTCGHQKGMTGPIGYVRVDDMRQSLQSLLDAGAQVQDDVHDVGGGRLVASVRDADGNVTGLMPVGQGSRRRARPGGLSESPQARSRL